MENANPVESEVKHPDIPALEHHNASVTLYVRKKARLASQTFAINGLASCANWQLNPDMLLVFTFAISAHLSKRLRMNEELLRELFKKTMSSRSPTG